MRRVHAKLSILDIVHKPRHSLERVYLKSYMAFKCFWVKVCEKLLLLKTKVGLVILFNFPGLVCFDQDRDSFSHLNVQSLTFFKSSFKSFAEVCLHFKQLKTMIYYQQKVPHWRSNYLINHLHKLIMIMDLAEIRIMDL